MQLSLPIKLPDLGALVRSFQKRLKLLDWSITFEWIDDLVVPNTANEVWGLCWPNADRREAHIQVRTPKSPADLREVKDTIAHEMLHVLWSPGDVPRRIEENWAHTLESVLAASVDDPVFARVMTRHLPAIRDGQYEYKPRRVVRRKAPLRARGGSMPTDMLDKIQAMLAEGKSAEEINTFIEGMKAMAAAAEGDMDPNPEPETSPEEAMPADDEETDREPMAADDEDPMAQGDNKEPMAQDAPEDENMSARLKAAHDSALRAHFKARKWLNKSQMAFARTLDIKAAEAYLNTLPEPNPKAPESTASNPNPMPRMGEPTAPSGRGTGGTFVRPSGDEQFAGLFKISQYDIHGAPMAREGLRAPGVTLGEEGSPILATFSVAKVHQMMQMRATARHSREGHHRARALKIVTAGVNS